MRLLLSHAQAVSPTSVFGGPVMPDPRVKTHARRDRQEARLHYGPVMDRQLPGLVWQRQELRFPCCHASS